MPEMTIEDQVGQVMLVGFEGTSITPSLREAIEQWRVAGVVLFARNVVSPEQLAELTMGLQALARRSGLPGLIVAIDQEGGRVTRLFEEQGFTEFPSAMAIAATGDPANAGLVATALAEEMTAVGINLDFAPALDVNNNYANPVICTRSFGSDPLQVASYGLAFGLALQNAGFPAVAKHFPGHGDTAIDSHFGLPKVTHSRAHLEAVEFVPFRAAIQAGFAAIMSAHMTFPAVEPDPGLPATLSSRVLQDLLRGELGFHGLIMTDCLEMGALPTAGYPTLLAAARALAAGADLLLFSHSYHLQHQARLHLIESVRTGAIPAARLADAAHHVLEFKSRFGMLTPCRVDPCRAAAATGTQAHRRLASELAAQGVTMVRERTRLPPLLPERALLVVTPPAAGLAARLALPVQQISLAPTPLEIQETLERAASFERVVVATADVEQNPQQGELVRALLDQPVPVIVAATASPYDLVYFPEAPVYLASYGNNPPLLAALAGVLQGARPARGRLPVALPAQCAER